jgi:DNA-binding NtrC family response regulator
MSMDRPRILVVEDRPSVLKLVASILERAYDVTTAADGPAALALLRSATFDVVLTDVRMPGASGFEVLRAAREGARRAEVVMMTAYANVPDAVAAMRLGAYDYVTKPADADEIALVVARAAERVREREEPPGAAEARGDDLDRGEEPGDDISLGFRRAVEEARDRASRRYLSRLMGLFHGNVTQAARRAGMTRESLHRVLKRYGVRPEHPRDASAHEAPSTEAGARESA